LIYFGRLKSYGPETEHSTVPLTYICDGFAKCCSKKLRYITVLSRVPDQHHFNADPDPGFRFHFFEDTDPAFRSNADPNPDPASKNNADLCGSGSEILVPFMMLP
jgi:hypothetical protein